MGNKRKQKHRRFRFSRRFGECIKRRVEITLSRAKLRRILFTLMALVVGAGLVAEVLKSGLHAAIR
jgi:hypothetical protein